MNRKILAFLALGLSAISSANFGVAMWQSAVHVSSQVSPGIMKVFGTNVYILESFAGMGPQGVQYAVVPTAGAASATQSTSFNAPMFNSLYPADITTTSSNVLVLARESGSSTGVAVISYNLANGSPTQSAFIAAPANTGMWPIAIETAPSGNVYALWAYGTNTATPTNLTSYGVGKFSSSGTLLWSKTWTGTGSLQLSYCSNMQSTQDMVILSNPTTDQICICGTNNTGSGLFGEVDLWGPNGLVQSMPASTPSPTFLNHLTTDGTNIWACGQANTPSAPGYMLVKGTAAGLGTPLVIPVIFNPYPINSGPAIGVVHDSTTAMTYMIGQDNALAGALDLYGIPDVGAYWYQLGFVPSPASGQPGWPMVVDPCLTAGGVRGVDVPGVAVSPNTSYVGGWYYTGVQAAGFPKTATTSALAFGLICSDVNSVYILSGSSPTSMTLTQYR